MTTLTIPPSLQARIDRELATLPAVVGKVSLTFVFNCGTSRSVGSMKVTRTVEEEVRPC